MYDKINIAYRRDKFKKRGRKMANYKVFSRTEKSRDISHKLNEDCFLFTEYSFITSSKVYL